MVLRHRRIIMLVPEFKMWIGVVENRVDPENLGRYRVRVLGYHTDNKIDLPTEKLPWAVPLMPVTSASISGVGTTPRLVEGSSVVGFWADGPAEQQPVIMGSLPGIPTDATDPNKGFADPVGVYPRNNAADGYNKLGEPDISRLARGENAETHASLTQKRTARATGIPVAKAYHVPSVGEDLPETDYESGTWDEPHARFGTTDTGTYSPPGSQPTFSGGTTSVYPYNHVTETESGHIFEVDDTPGNGRIHEYHNSGTFYEIQADGTKVIKIVGDSYEIVVGNEAGAPGNKNVSITGDLNVTVKGNCKLRVDGNMYQEIGGNLTTFVKGSRHTKIEGNDLLEVGTSVGVSIKSDYAQRVGGNHFSEAVNTRSIYTGGSSYYMSGRKTEIQSTLSTSLTAGTSVGVTAGTGNVTILAPAGTIRASGLGMALTGTTSQIIAGGTQLFEASVTQTLAAPTQTIVAPVRTITGVTGHTGVYTVTGALSSTISVTAPIVQQGTIVLGTHKHLGVQTGGGISGIPTP